MWQALSNWVAALTGLFGGGHSGAMVKIPRARHGHGLSGSRILREQNLSLDDWLDSGYWAIVISSNVTAIRYGEPDPFMFRDEEEERLLIEQRESVGQAVRNAPKGSMRRYATLYVAFASRGLSGTRAYKYFGVERYVAQAMFLAPSMGRFVNNQLRGGTKKGSTGPAQATGRYAYAGPFSPGQL